MGRDGHRYNAGRPAHNVKAEQMHRVDIRLWARAGYFDNVGNFACGWNRGGEPSGSINVLTTTDSATLIYRVKDRHDDQWHDKRQRITLVSTPCQYGGARKWFTCPVCARRCEVLYLRARRFACRKCQRVAYRSQSGGPIDRLIHKSQKLRTPIENGKPKWMRWATFERRWELAYAVEEVVDSRSAARWAGLLRLV